jgi:hypothetical protein
MESTPLELREPDLSDAERLAFESIARRCARFVRGCTTDEQYSGLIGNIVEALAFASGKTRPMDLQKSESN